jgi:8-oxo-dGTP diphosphatase
MDASGSQRFRFCPKCGAQFELLVLYGRERLSCTECAFVFYQNPVASVAVLIVDSGSVLLTQRRGGQEAGQWDVPGGYVEYDEDIREAARRELLEETGLEVSVGAVFEVLSNFHTPLLHTVGVWFIGVVTAGRLQAADDALDARFFPLDALPELAFESDRIVLERLRAERFRHA